MFDAEEEWRDIVGYPNYQVSNFGRVWNISTNREIRPVLVNNGYVHVTLCNTHGRNHKSIHRLVAQAFLGDLLPKLEINHLDGNKTNNMVWNLEICTSSDNHRHAYALGLSSIKHLQKPIRCVETGEIFHSITAAAHTFNTYQGNISQVLTGKRTKANGFTFEYIDSQQEALE